MASEFKLVTVPGGDLSGLSVGDRAVFSGTIIAGRDAVLPKVCGLIDRGELGGLAPLLQGAAIFHTAVSDAGVGPTSSNKVEIEESFGPLLEAGARVFLGKGELGAGTVRLLGEYGAVYAVVPPVTALLGRNLRSRECAAFPELGMEALWRLELDGCPGIVAAAHGESIFDRKGLADGR